MMPAWPAAVGPGLQVLGMLAPRLTSMLPLAANLSARLTSTLTAHKNGMQHPFLAVPDGPDSSDAQLPRSGIVLHGLGQDQAYAHPLVQYRASYPEAVWSRMVAATDRGPKQFPVAIDIGVGTGRGAVELARRGFRVVGVEATPNLLARTHQSAKAQGLQLSLISARMEQQLLPPGCADLVSVMHGLHLVDTQMALHEAHRLLRPDGLLVAAWNDRDLSSTFIDELEGLLERFNPAYQRHLKQRALDHWGPVLTQGHLFRLAEYSVHPHPLHLKGATPLLDIVDCLSCVRQARHPSATRRDLHSHIVELVHRHYGKEPFDLPLETKLYLLRRNHVEGLHYPQRSNGTGMKPMFQ